jgi:hypothetical protein
VVVKVAATGTRRRRITKAVVEAVTEPPLEDKNRFKGLGAYAARSILIQHPKMWRGLAQQAGVLPAGF